MEHPPHNPSDHDPDVPKRERLEAGEIDLTGSVEQEDDLRDVISDAIVEANASGGAIPDWGARALARALANWRDDPTSGALHPFAVTGRIDKDALTRELGEAHASATDEEAADWALLLGVYINDLPDTAPVEERVPGTTQDLGGHDAPGPAGESEQENQPSHDTALPSNKPSVGGPAARFTEYLRQAAAEADVRGEAIAPEDAQSIAAMLAGFLVTMDVKDSAMIRLAETGELDQPKLHDECQQLKSIRWKLPDVHIWVEHLEQFLAQCADEGVLAPGTPETVEPASDNPQVVQGMREHGAAFHAYLQLPDTDPRRGDLLQSFENFYIGTFEAMDDLLDALTEISNWQQAVDDLANTLGIDGCINLDRGGIEAMVREVWDIVEYRGKFHVFEK